MGASPGRGTAPLSQSAGQMPIALSTILRDVRGQPASVTGSGCRQAEAPTMPGGIGTLGARVPAGTLPYCHRSIRPEARNADQAQRRRDQARHRELDGTQTSGRAPRNLGAGSRRGCTTMGGTGQPSGAGGPHASSPNDAPPSTAPLLAGRAGPRRARGGRSRPGGAGRLRATDRQHFWDKMTK